MAKPSGAGMAASAASPLHLTSFFKHRYSSPNRAGRGIRGKEGDPRLPSSHSTAEGKPHRQVQQPWNGMQQVQQNQQEPQGQAAAHRLDRAIKGKWECPGRGCTIPSRNIKPNLWARAFIRPHIDVWMHKQSSQLSNKFTCSHCVTTSVQLPIHI